MPIELRPRNGSLDLKNIKPTVFIDNVQRCHFRSAPLESFAALRFSKLIDATLKCEIDFPSPACQIAWSLIIFDAVTTVSDLAAAIANLDSVYLWRDHACLDWINENGCQQRRYLSAFTQSSLAAPRTGKATTSQIIEEIEMVLRAQFPIHQGAYTLSILMADSNAWLRENIPDYLYAHAAGLVPITSLPRSALAREQSQLALLSESDGLTEVDQHDGFQSAIEAYLDQTSEDRGSWLISEMIRICRRNKSLSNSSDKKRMLKGCLALASHAGNSGPISGLILAWVIDLLESGTRLKKVLKAITPAKYVAAAANLLLTTFRGKVLEEIPAPVFYTTYKGLLEGLSPSKARTLSSALSSWHFFITTWFDIAPLWSSLHHLVPQTSPKANILWPHETENIRGWLETGANDDRLHGQLCVAFEILCGMRIRANELLNGLHFIRVFSLPA